MLTLFLNWFQRLVVASASMPQHGSDPPPDWPPR
jgi:hypothetical protein